MARLNKVRQKELEPKRMEYALRVLTDLSIPAIRYNDNEINFEWKGNTIQFFPYSGWFQGKGIKPGRGIENILKQLV